MRKMMIGIVSLLFGLMLVLSACSPADQNSNAVMDAEKLAMAEKQAMEEKSAMMEKNDSSAMVKDDSVMMENTSEVAMMEKSDSPSSAMMEFKANGVVLAGVKSQYIEFNQVDYDAALASGKTIVLNFYANWCPACKEERMSAIAGFNELENENVVGFQVNYKDSDTDDSEVDMAKKFGITSQHTRVTLVDGKVTSKVNTAWSSDDYVAELATV